MAVRSGANMFARELKSGAVQRNFAGPEATSAATIAAAGRENYTGRSRWVYQELRDRKVAMFIDHLPEGVWELRYELRAETPGAFHALPVLGHAMYVPEIRGNSREIRIKVEDRP